MKLPGKPVKEKLCSTCGSSFNCGPETGKGDCWCSGFPAIIPINSDKDCECPACFNNTIKVKINNFIDDYKAGKIENTAPLYRKPGQELVEDIDFYIEDNKYVFTSWYLLKRGYCCGNGCRHCPYTTGNEK